MSDKTYDINQPILVIVRRGRGGRGYAVAPVDSPTDVAACADVNQLGDAIVEILDDEKQPRVDIDELMRATDAGGDPESLGDEDEGDEVEGEDEDGDEEEEDEEEDEDEEVPWHQAPDPAEALFIAGISKLVEKGRKMSKRSKRSRRRGRSRKSKR